MDDGVAKSFTSFNCYTFDKNALLLISVPPRRGKIKMGVLVKNQNHPFLYPSPSRGRKLSR